MGENVIKKEREREKADVSDDSSSLIPVHYGGASDALQLLSLVFNRCLRLRLFSFLFM